MESETQDLAKSEGILSDCSHESPLQVLSVVFLAGFVVSVSPITVSWLELSPLLLEEGCLNCGVSWTVSFRLGSLDISVTRVSRLSQAEVEAISSPGSCLGTDAISSTCSVASSHDCACSQAQTVDKIFCLECTSMEHLDSSGVDVTNEPAMKTFWIDPHFRQLLPDEGVRLLVWASLITSESLSLFLKQDNCNEDSSISLVLIVKRFSSDNAVSSLRCWISLKAVSSIESFFSGALKFSSSSWESSVGPWITTTLSATSSPTFSTGDSPTSEAEVSRSVADSAVAEICKLVSTADSLGTLLPTLLQICSFTSWTR